MPTQNTLPSNEEMDQLSARGWAIYDNTLKAILEPEHNGEVVAIHLDSGDYEVAKNSPSATRGLRVRRPTGLLMIADIGPAKMDSLTYRMLANRYLAEHSK